MLSTGRGPGADWSANQSPSTVLSQKAVTSGHWLCKQCKEGRRRMQGEAGGNLPMMGIGVPESVWPRGSSFSLSTGASFQVLDLKDGLACFCETGFALTTLWTLGR